MCCRVVRGVGAPDHGPAVIDRIGVRICSSERAEVAHLPVAVEEGMNDGGGLTRAVSRPARMPVVDRPTTCPLSLMARADGTQAGEGPQVDVLPTAIDHCIIAAR